MLVHTLIHVGAYPIEYDFIRTTTQPPLSSHAPPASHPPAGTPLHTWIHHADIPVAEQLARLDFVRRAVNEDTNPGGFRLSDSRRTDFLKILQEWRRPLLAKLQ